MPDLRDDELVSPWRVARYEVGDEELTSVAPPVLAGLEWLPATVPGAVHYDLMAAGQLANPYASSASAEAARWVAESDWLYSTVFDAPAGAAADRSLVLEGVDTFADVWLNGTLLGQTANAYRSYRLPVPETLMRPTGNELVLHLKGHRRMIEPKAAEARKRLSVQGGHPDRLLKSLVRRYQRNTFSNSSLLNLGVHVHGIGVNKPVRLVSEKQVTVSEARLTVLELTDSAAQVRVDVSVLGTTAASAGLSVEVELAAPEAETVRAVTALRGIETALVMTVASPQLWWPQGYGSPTRYTMTVRLLHDGRLVDETQTMVGLRTVELIDEQAGVPTFQLRVNGQRVYVRGTNFVPVDYLKVHDSWQVYERLFTLLEHGNYNLVRLWGGGAVEDERFYDRCDELGIMLWQDLLLHSNVYPDYDQEFVEEFRAESAELIRRARRHPALVLLCGGNEQQEGWDEWAWKADTDRFYGESLARDVAGELAKELVPELPFVYNSPHGGRWSGSPVAGDTHTWGNFYNATKDPQFVTETCWSLESYSRPETLLRAMDLDVQQLRGPGWRETWTQLTRLPLMTKFPFSSYHGAESLPDYLRSLEIEHAMADHHGLSMLRLRGSSGSGIVYWSLNKGGPLFQFGCIDYHGYPLMSYYVVKRVFAELLVGVYRDIDDIRVVASNATGTPVDAEVRTMVLDVDGEIAYESVTPVTMEPGEIARVLDLPAMYRQMSDRTRDIVHVQLVVAGSVVSEDTFFATPLAEVAASRHPLAADVVKTGEGRWRVSLRSDGFVKMVCLESNQKLLFSDNYFGLAPGSRSVDVSLLERTSSAPPELTVSALDSGAQHSLPLP
jgi:beta-mannosidase